MHTPVHTPRRSYPSMAPSLICCHSAAGMASCCDNPLGIAFLVLGFIIFPPAVFFLFG